MSDVIKKVCKCEKCGNEAEMEITCSLPEDDHAKDAEKVKGTGTCSHCGNEAEMWIDM